MAGRRQGSGQHLFVPARKPVPELHGPLPPEPPAEQRMEAHSTISSDEEWEDERVADADLSGEDADHLQLTRCELQRVRFTGARLQGLDLTDVLAIDCDFSGAILHEASMQRVELRNCRMTGVVVSQSDLRHVRFVECKLDGANLRRARADHVEMSDCSLVDADFYETLFTKSTLDGCDLRDSEFSKASAAGLRLGGSKLDGVRGAMSMRGVVITGDQVLPLALSLMTDLGVSIQNDDDNS